MILPGSKQTLRDLGALNTCGLDKHLKAYANSGGSVLGICGGMQMLGNNLEDPCDREGERLRPLGWPGTTSFKDAIRD